MSNMSDWDLQQCNRTLHTMSFNMYDKVQSHVAFEDVQSVVKHGVLWMHLYTNVTELLQHDPVDECIQNMSVLHHVHRDPAFLREFNSGFLPEDDSESIVVQYAISLKRYKLSMVLEKEKLQSILHSLIMVEPENVPLLIPSVREKVNAYLHYKKDVCNSIYRMFEYVIEYEELQNVIKHPALLPSSDPLLGQEAQQSLPLPQQEWMEQSTPAQGLRLTPQPYPEELPESHERLVLRSSHLVDDTPPFGAVASALPQSESDEE